MRDVLKTRRAFAVWAVTAAALCVLALAALRMPRGDALAQDARATPTPYEAQMPRAEGGVDDIGEESGVRPQVVNPKPLRDVLAEAGELIKQGRLGPEARADVTAKGERNADGSLKPETVVLDWTTGSDEVSASLAQRFISALGESRYLYDLEGAKEVSVRVRLDETNALLSIAADLSSAESAARLAKSYVEMRARASKSKGAEYEAELYKSVKASSDGRRFAFTFEMPKESLGRIIDDTLGKSAARAND